MTNQELYKQAILDAKAVRETALAAAKQSLSEAFEPRIMEMMRLKLSEELEEGQEEVEESVEEMEEAMDKQGNMQEEGMGGDEGMTEESLDAILAELDALSEEIEEGAEEIEEGHNKADGYVGKKGKGGMGYDEKAKTTHGDKKLHEAEDDEDADEDADEDSQSGVWGKVGGADESRKLVMGLMSGEEMPA